MDSKGKNQQASEAFMAFLTSSVFAKHLKLDHALPLFLCLFLQWVTLLAINNRTEKQKVINKPNIWLKAVRRISSAHTVSEWDALMQMGLPLIFPMASYKTLSNS